MRNEMGVKRLSILCMIVLLAISMTAGCAGTNATANLQRGTSEYIATNIGGSIPPQQILISDVNTRMGEVKWKADTPQAKYDCTADEMFHRVYCVEGD